MDMEEEGVPPPPVVVVEEEGVVVPPPPVVLVAEEGVVQPPPVVVVEEEEEVAQAPPLVGKEVVAVQPPPLVVEEEVVVQPPPLVEEEEAVVQAPPLVNEEVVAVQPPPLVVEEEVVVVQPPPLVEEEEAVVQAPPLVEEEVVVVQPPQLVVEEEVVVQPPPLLEEEEGVQELPAPDPHALLLWQWNQWAAATLGHAAHNRHLVATEVDSVIARCRTARMTLREVAAVLLDEHVDAAETIYTDLLEAVSRGMDSLLIGPAAKIVDSLFNWPGPLAGAIDVARDLVHDSFYYPRPDGGELQGARRDLGYVVHVLHADAGHLFSHYAGTVGVGALPGGQGAFQHWVTKHNQADAEARLALHRLNIAVERSLAADLSVRLSVIMPASRVRPGAGPLVPVAALRLQQTIDAVDDVLVALLDMQDTLGVVEQDVLNVIFGGQDHPPP